jgi:drug/metabolite transporter (DMT)-like permease
LALTLLGAVVVLGNDLILHPHLSNGDLMAVISSLFYAGYFMVTQKGRQSVDAITHTWIMTLVASLVLFSITRAYNMPLTGYPPLTYLSFLGAALLCQVGGMFSVTYALGKLPASLVSPTMIAQPVLTALLAIPLFGEPLMPGQWIGGLLTLSGIYLLNTNTDASSMPAMEAVAIPPEVH